ncbi:hypothetical protein ACFTZI_08315 [Streptomyces decoyicus]|uniref:hypothetical protein n=1 Tax=Streptomyces decoyicus TaxID=249567 RepID=UPI00363B9873
MSRRSSEGLGDFTHGPADGDTDLISASAKDDTVNWLTNYRDTSMPNGCRLTSKERDSNGKIYTLGMCDDYTRITLLDFKGGDPPIGHSAAFSMTSFTPWYRNRPNQPKCI